MGPRDDGGSIRAPQNTQRSLHQDNSRLTEPFSRSHASTTQNLARATENREPSSDNHERDTVTRGRRNSGTGKTGEDPFDLY
jgi:hypothetical protein